MKKLAVIFPGTNYNSNKPLLYYIKKVLVKEEFEVVEIEYGNLPKEKEEAFKIAKDKASESIKDILWSNYDEVLFVSKSIGTVVAGLIASKLNVKVRHIWLTPVNESLPFMISEGIVFSGKSDPMITTSSLISECDNNKVPLYLYDGANHTIETGVIKENLRILVDIIDKCEKYILALEKENPAFEAYNPTELLTALEYKYDRIIIKGAYCKEIYKLMKGQLSETESMGFELGSGGVATVLAYAINATRDLFSNSDKVTKEIERKIISYKLESASEDNVTIKLKQLDY